jgi:hypothetical protein
MKASGRFCSAWRNCILSAVASLGSLAGWRFWFIFGGWDRQEHWFDGVLWGVSALVGWGTAISAMRSGEGASLVRVLAFFLWLFNTSALVILFLFLNLLARGGPHL